MILPHEPLEDAWARVKLERPTISLKELALLWGVTDGAVSQYLRGHTTIHTEAALWFARYLELPITQIWPDFPFRDLCPGKFPPDAIAVARDWMRIPEPQRSHFKALLHSAALLK